ncbi:M48 family metallopeptidase [Alkaliphilus sp. B6464]|uniref:M48 family metallopeptidase n=1 Tax=Alkaliphilus sp. B6464 TaxID=2731219 RepID=UPI001BA81943|nr:SprT family zinc-dependent metalloprotease [Alkaliphilus sp. B6464]QUH18952.1 M48 family metallopeptidase [Alkaliphilus sp. B6464]
MEKHEISYGGKVIEFELNRKNVKNVNLNVKPDMAIMISANENVPIDFIKNFVKNNAPWILKNIKHFEETQPYENLKEYVSGETFKYLGKQYRLKVFESEKEEVKYFRGFIHLYVKDKTNYERKEKLVEAWFRQRAEIIFNESLDKVYSLVQKHNISKPNVMIKIMKARWGSCIKEKNIILLNYELIKAPKYCIDYVVLHELIHFIEGNHSKDFYSLMTVLMPDWRDRKEILDEEVVRDL